MSYFPSISNASHLKLHFCSGKIIFGKIKKQYSNITILPLPTKLVNYRNKNYFTACAVLLFSLGLSIYVQEYAPSLLGLLFTAFFLWKGLSASQRYNSGRIAEITATCTGVRPSFYRDRFTVTFAALNEEDEYVYYQFVVPNKRMREEFIIGAAYIIYFDRDNTHALLGNILVSSCDF